MPVSLLLRLLVRLAHSGKGFDGFDCEDGGGLKVGLSDGLKVGLSDGLKVGLSDGLKTGLSAGL